jgi:hypothetical protein
VDAKETVIESFVNGLKDFHYVKSEVFDTWSSITLK